MAVKLKHKLTEDQRQAVEQEASPLVVRAGAGSGKTTVLVERYVRLVLEDNVEPARILAATFTEKAAAEMKERVAEKFIEAGRPELVARLNAAPICTLHSYCNRLIAPRALEQRLDPGYRILEQYEADLLQEETLGDVLRKWRADFPERLSVLVGALHWSGDYGLRPGRMPSSRGFARQFLNLVDAVRCAGHGGEEPFTPLNIDRQDNRQLVGEAILQLEALIGDPQGYPEKSVEKAQNAYDALKEYLELPNPQSPEALEKINELKTISLQVGEAFKGVLRRIKDDIRPRLLDEYYEGSYEAVYNSLNHLYADFLLRYESSKQEIGALDFLDLEEIALNILRDDPSIKPVDYILIDEAQDLNGVQWELIECLGRGAPVFTVGDIQQSIYGFRNADVDLFVQSAHEAKEGPGLEIPLAENFRSRRSVLDVVNQIFEGLWAGTDIPFLKLEEKYPYPLSEESGVELLVASGSDRQKAREMEARHLARRLAELVRGQSFQIYRQIDQAGDGHPGLEASTPHWGDVLVLVRSSSSFDPLERAFRDVGIPFTIHAGRGFWDALEISDLMALLRALEDPGDSFSLACLLRSPALEFSDDDLVELRLQAIGGSSGKSSTAWNLRPLYEGLQTAADGEAAGGTLPRRAATFLRLFDQLYQWKDRLPLRALFETWIRETGLEAHWSAQPDGHLMLSNVRKFLRLCDARAGESPARLRASFDDIRIRDVQEGSAPQPLSEEGAVRVMTVHAAKGLEAPIVALFDMNYSPRGSSRAFAFSKESGAAFCLRGADPLEDKHKPLLFAAIEQDTDTREQAENQRVLYVAMTRAREKLILSASSTIGDRGVGRIAGWFKLLVEQLKLDLENIFTESASTLESVPLLTKDGHETGITLRRAWPEVPAEEYISVSEPLQPEDVQKPPAGFPAPPQAGFAPIPVVEWLQERGLYPIEYQLAEDGDLLQDEEVKPGGIALGRWAHRLLEVIPLDAPPSEWEGYARREGWALFGIEPDRRDVDEILRFTDSYFRSPLAQKVMGARWVQREFPLLFEMDGTLLRGKLDLAFEDEAGWTLVDYKTDRPQSAGAAQRKAAYQTQILLYSLAWEKLVGKMPQEALLFYLSTGQMESVPLDRRNLDRVVQLIAHPSM